MIKPGDLAFVKTSEERCFVLDVVPTADVMKKIGNVSGYSAKVRLPIANRELGIVHTEQFFFVEELETASEKVQREYAEMCEARKAMNSANRDAELAATGLGDATTNIA